MKRLLVPSLLPPCCRLAPRDTQDAAQTEDASTFCEVLGPRQRRWLDQVLSGSRAPLKVIASGSVLFGSTGLGENAAENEWQGRCSGAPLCVSLLLGWGGACGRGVLPTPPAVLRLPIYLSFNVA